MKKMMFVMLFCVGCGATSNKMEVEHVGVLVDNPTHVYQEPVHQTTDVSQTLVSVEE
jgi:hypothetical protein